MKIALITDLHIGDDLTPVMDVDTYGHTKDVLARATKWVPDHIIVAGDLCYRAPNEFVYKTVHKLLADTGIPFDVISGNHDDPKMLSTEFYMGNTLTEEEHYFSRHIGGFPFIFLDTTLATMSELQWVWFEERISTTMSETIYIVMHHPPIYCGVLYMESEHAFEEQTRFEKLIRRYEKKFVVFSGHYHVERTVVQNNLSLFITPSCFIQIDPDEEAFKVDHKIPGYRQIEIMDGTLKTNVVYVNNSEF